MSERANATRNQSRASNDFKQAAIAMVVAEGVCSTDMPATRSARQILMENNTVPFTDAFTGAWKPLRRTLNKGCSARRSAYNVLSSDQNQAITSV
jgi:hypothetical protein